MEEVGNEWRCPKCVEETNKAKEDAQQAELQKKLKEREEIAKEAQTKKQKAVTPTKRALKKSNSSKSLDGPKDDKVCRTIPQRGRFHSRAQSHFLKQAHFLGGVPI